MGIAQSSEVTIEWTSADDTNMVSYMRFVGAKPANDGSWRQFLEYLKNGQVSLIFHVHLTVDNAPPAMLYSPNPERINAVAASMVANRPSKGGVEFTKFAFTSNVTVTKEGLEMIEAAKRRVEQALASTISPAAEPVDEESEMKVEAVSEAVVSDTDQRIAAEFASKTALTEKTPGTGLKTITKIKAGEKYLDTAVYPLAADGFVVTFQPHTGVSEWINSKRGVMIDDLRAALMMHSDAGSPYKVVVILNLDDDDFKREPLITDYLLDKVEEFLDVNKLKGPAVVNVLTPGFDVGQRITYSERPRTMPIQVAWSPSLYKIIE
jgi:hypothetical protein